MSRSAGIPPAATLGLEGVISMPRFLIEATYTLDGLRGLFKDGGSGRVEAVRKMAESVGGRLESFDFSFGDPDTHVICELPDNKSAAAIALAIGASGGATTKTIALLTPAEVDQAVHQTVDYRAPGI
ncbi:GYD domain-containing protein [Dactylosporangium fulvum]|uniref:GYD domain-containing protein n=1 Tax=Dactylosporangium fulvum TaxID=53359 RepID=A0ABY5VYG7_9ACTN|nr:GYD domain-containing protein [Dactylosporangium fulvum]UWP82190.1 GYD domain-containing protein [Dactylosporangium fulvum]